MNISLKRDVYINVLKGLEKSFGSKLKLIVRNKRK